MTTAQHPRRDDEQQILEFGPRACGETQSPGTSAAVAPTPRRRPAYDPVKAERKAELARTQAYLLPLVLRHGALRAGEGFTADDVRYWAITHGLATGYEKPQRALSWIGPWLAQLARRGTLAIVLHFPGGPPVRRRSERAQAHGNASLVYRLVA